MQAEEIAEKLCESVAASLEGKKLGSFTRISSTVQVFNTSHLTKTSFLLCNLCVLLYRVVVIIWFI